MSAGSYLQQLQREGRIPRHVIGKLGGELWKQPDHIADALAERYAQRYADEAERQGQARAAGEHPGYLPPHAKANRELLDYAGEVAGLLPAKATDTLIRGWAAARVKDCQRARERAGPDEFEQYGLLATLVNRFGIVPPRPDSRVTLTGCVRRMCCPRWWRRQARNVHGRQREQKARALGLVKRTRGRYVSDDAFYSWCERQRTNAQILADTWAICETGEAYTLADIAQRTIANPKLRRAELMTRVSGIEEAADKRRDRALFVTWTAPAGYHAVKDSTGRLLPGARYTPRDGQDWLKEQWAKIRAEFQRHGITAYGLRVAEPHLDGTPHWHLLIFCPWHQRGRVIEVMRPYALGPSPNRARERAGFQWETIQRGGGRSATGYVSKYIAKAVDGHAVGDLKTIDENGREVWHDADAADNAARVRAWASLWSIRQFQFFGVPPVGVWRELRRLDPLQVRHPDQRAPELMRAACDAGDYHRYIELMGGPCVPRDAMPARVRMAPTERAGEYGEPIGTPFVECYGRPLMTRPLTWVIEYLPGGRSDASAICRDRRAFESESEDLGLGAGFVSGAGAVSDRAGDAHAGGGFSLSTGTPSLERDGAAGAPWTRGNNCKSEPEEKARGPDARNKGGGISGEQRRPPPLNGYD